MPRIRGLSCRCGRRLARSFPRRCHSKTSGIAGSHLPQSSRGSPSRRLAGAPVLPPRSCEIPSRLEGHSTATEFYSYRCHGAARKRLACNEQRSYDASIRQELLEVVRPHRIPTRTCQNPTWQWPPGMAWTDSHICILDVAYGHMLPVHNTVFQQRHFREGSVCCASAQQTSERPSCSSQKDSPAAGFNQDHGQRTLQSQSPWP